MEQKEVVGVLKAIISSYNGGIPIDKIDAEFAMWEHQQIPYLKFGYPSFLHFIRDYPEIKIDKNAEGESVFVLKHSKNAKTNEMNLECNGKSNYRRNNIPPPYNRKRTNKPRKNVKNGYYSQSEETSGYFSMEDEVLRPPKIITDPYKSLTKVHEPILNGQQLIGDDFFLQLAIKNIGVPVWRKYKNAALRSGLCISGQTIGACSRRLKNITSISNKVTIMLGSVDIYQGRQLEKMKQDFLELLSILENDFNLSKRAITICTIPPLANVSFMTEFEKCSTLTCFNNWLRQLVYNRYDIISYKYLAYNIIDFHKEFVNDCEGVNYDLFQEDARYVSGTRNTYVLFNKEGRSRAVGFFFGGKRFDEYDDFPPAAWSDI